ncbi:MAG: CBS domain-containing protein [Candidatus Levyibacteriota bacterium]
MKVRDAMRTSSVWVEDSLPVKDLARIFYTAGTNGFPVVHNKKLVGFITEEDMFSQLYNVEGEELRKPELMKKILDLPVEKIMIRDVVSVNPETNLIEAQLLMYRYNFTRLPVVDAKGNIVGTIARNDVFGHILKNEIPKLEEGQYASFVMENYDEMVEWEKRFDYEFPTLFRVFNKHNAKKILELGMQTGEYAIRLAKEGIEEVVGVDNNEAMVQFANSKRNKLPEALKKCVSFAQTDYSNLSKLFPKNSFDAVICMGGALPYFPTTPEAIINQIHTVLRPDGAVIFQLLNLERVIEDRRRFLYFKIIKGKEEKDVEEMYIEFFDVKDQKTLIHNVIKFSSEANGWVYHGINSIEIRYVKNDEIEPLLKKAGFKDIMVSGNKGEYKGAYGQMSLVKPFDPLSSEWMTVVATK